LRRATTLRQATGLAVEAEGYGLATPPPYMGRGRAAIRPHLAD
jgi:hypothetical protein